MGAHEPARHSGGSARRYHSPMVVKIVAADPEDRARGPTRVVIGDLPGLRKSMQFVLAIFQPHGHVRRPPRPPEEGEVISEALVLIERRDRAEHPLRALESDRGVHLPGERFRGRIEKILDRFAEGEIGIERDRQWLRMLDLTRGRHAGAPDDGETKESQRKLHDGCMKREERDGVNFRAWIEEGPPFAPFRESAKFPA